MSDGEAPTNAGSKPNFAGKYSLVKNENFDAFLSANGANWLIRKMVSSSSPSLELTQDGDKFHIKLISAMMTRESKFVVGEDYEETQQDGNVMLISTHWDNDKLVQNFTPKVVGAGKVQKHTRELDGDQLTVTLEVGDVVAKRIFKKIV